MAGDVITGSGTRRLNETQHILKDYFTPFFLDEVVVVGLDVDAMLDGIEDGDVDVSTAGEDVVTDDGGFDGWELFDDLVLLRGGFLVVLFCGGWLFFRSSCLFLRILCRTAASPMAVPIAVPAVSKPVRMPSVISVLNWLPKLFSL